jgi:hypothetical protein
MEKRRRTWLRGGITLGVVGVVAAALLVSPAGAHIDGWPHLKGHIKKIATKIAKKQARTIVQTTVGPTIFIEETELTRYGQIKLNLGGSQEIGAFGPFTLTARCIDEPGDAQDIRAQIEITTSENNSIFATDDDTDTDFDTGDTGIWGGGYFGDLVGDPADYWSEETEGHAAAPAGTAIDGRTAIYTNFAGSPCVFAGYVITTAPQA